MGGINVMEFIQQFPWKPEGVYNYILKFIRSPFLKSGGTSLASLTTLQVSFSNKVILQQWGIRWADLGWVGNPL